VANSCRQFGIGAGLAGQSRQLFEQWPVALAKGGDVGRVFGVDPGAIGQHNAQAGQGVVGILRGTAAHAAGVVGDDAANFAGVDRGRVGADFAPERGQPRVSLRANDAGLQADLRALAANLLGVPVVPEHDQHGVADGLARQAGAGGAEGDGHLVASGQTQQFDHFVLRLNANHQLGDQPIKARVSAKSQGGERVVETAVLRYQPFGIAHKGGGQTHASSRISTIRSFGPWAP